jgi:uncharacterized membrane protein YgcG
MIFQAYDEDLIRNLQIQDTAKELLENGRLTPPQYKQIKTAFPIDFKQGSPFVRIGLFLFTSLCIVFSIFLFIWITGSIDNDQRGMGGLLLFFGIGLTALNEYVIKTEHWYRQGSDNALCYGAIICLVTGLSFMFQIFQPLPIAVISLIFLTLATVRYGDPVLAFGAFYTLILSFTIGFGDSNLPRMAMPIVCAALSLGVYFFVKTAVKNEKWFYWEDCFNVLEIMGLVGFYGSLNYYTVAQVFENRAYNVVENGAENVFSLPFSLFFAVLTAVIPVVYLVTGIRKKDRILWILGSLGIVASIVTYRHYHSVMPIEWAFTLAGIALLALAIFLMKYLKTPQNGFVYQPEKNKNNVLESLIVNQFMPQSPQNSEGGVEFGGGDFGGGGASDNY